MLRFNNLSIGTKLAVTSGLSVLLVIGMLVNSMYANSQVKTSNELAMSQMGIVRDVTEFEIEFLKVRMAVRNMRLATSKAELDAANTLAQQEKSIENSVERIMPKLRLPENRERAAKALNYVKQYIGAALSETLPAKIEALGVDPKDGDRMVALANKMQHIQHERLDPAGDQAQALLHEISDTATKKAKELTDASEQEMASAAIKSVAIGVAILLVLIGAVLLSLTTIARPIRRLIDVLAQIEKGNTKVEIKGTERGDEVGSLAKAVVVIRASRDAELANNRIKTALDVVRSNVMLSDDQYNIIYMNDSLHQMLRESEAELRKVLPGFDSSKIIGANIDVFHKNPAHQRGLLDKLTGTYETRITVGSQKFKLVATAVMGKDGKRAGTVVEWRNETVERAIEGEVDAVVKAAIAGDFSLRVPTEGKKEFMLNLSTAINDLCENVAGAVADVARVLSALAAGNLTQRVTAEYQGAFATLKSDLNATADRLSGDDRRHQDCGTRSQQRGGRNLGQHDRPVAAYRRAGGQPRRDFGFDGANLRDGEEECRECPASQQTDVELPRRCRPRRHGGGAMPSRRWRGSRIPRARSPTSSASLTRSRGRPTCWRSMRRSKRRAPATPAAASLSSPRRCAAWRSVRRRRQKTSRT